MFPTSEDGVLEHLKLSVSMTQLQLFKQQHDNVNFYNLGLMSSFSLVQLDFEWILFFLICELHEFWQGQFNNDPKSYDAPLLFRLATCSLTVGTHCFSCFPKKQ